MVARVRDNARHLAKTASGLCCIPMKLRPLVVLILVTVARLSAKVTLAPLFTDCAVLQRDKPIPIWGLASPGERITVQFHGMTAAATADSAGAWKAKLPAQPASNFPSDLLVRGEDTVTVHDVVVGEVWLCSGQSNMEFLVWDATGTTFRVQNGPAEVAAANYPLIRQFTVARKVSATPEARWALPAVPLAKAGQYAPPVWAICTPATVGRFTAAGYFFARDIYQRLSVPVGIIDSTWGGTPIESWEPREALSSDPAFAAVDQRWAKVAKPLPQRMPTGLFNGMIQPLIPYALRGILWYQGEANANAIGAKEYHALFAAMITSWRAKFGQGDVPFYWVQLASFAHSPYWAYLREGQQQTLSLPHTGQAVAIDIGEEKNIHPRNKQEVGRRLALIAANQVYGLPVEYSGPIFAEAKPEGAAMRVRFKFADKGLKAGAGQPVATCELAGADRKFYPATATIDRNTLVVRSDKVPQPVAVRYAWAGFAEGHLYNTAGLPAAPFRSDDW